MKNPQKQQNFPIIRYFIASLLASFFLLGTISKILNSGLEVVDIVFILICLLTLAVIISHTAESIKNS